MLKDAWSFTTAAVILSLVAFVCIIALAGILLFSFVLHLPAWFWWLRGGMVVDFGNENNSPYPDVITAWTGAFLKALYPPEMAVAKLLGTGHSQWLPFPEEKWSCEVIRLLESSPEYQSERLSRNF